MTDSRTAAEAEQNRQMAIRFAAQHVDRWRKERRSRDVTIRFAAESGASIDELAGATGLSEAKVKRILWRRRLH